MTRYFPGQAISRIHGQPRRIDGVLVVPMYHPAAALHQGSLRRTIMDDFKKLPGILNEVLAKEEAAEEAPEEPAAVQIQLL
jgi:DNA polymerase